MSGAGRQSRSIPQHRAEHERRVRVLPVSCGTSVCPRPPPPGEWRYMLVVERDGGGTDRVLSVASVRLCIRNGSRFFQAISTRDSPRQTGATARSHANCVAALPNIHRVEFFDRLHADSPRKESCTGSSSQDGEEGLPQTARKPPPLRPQRRAHCQAVAEQLRLLAQPRARQRATGRAPLLAVTATAHARGINGSHAALADPYSMERVCASQVSIAVAVRPFGGGARWAQANTS